MVASLAVKATAAEAWEAVKLLQVGSEQVRKSQGQRLSREFETIRFNDGELVDDFTMRLSNLIAALGIVGETIEASKVVEKLLRVVPKRFSQVVVVIEVTADQSKLTLEEVVGCLRAAEDRMEEDNQAPVSKADGKLLLTEEEWAAQMKSRRQERSGGGSKPGKRAPRNGTSSGGGGKHGSSSAGREVKLDKCRRCGKTGHWACECRSKPKSGGAHAAQAEEDDPTLLMTQVDVEPATPLLPSPPAVAAPLPSKAAPVKLLEEKALAYLDGTEPHDETLWFLDTGATNHMTGARNVFAELDENIYGTVRFSDGSTVNIERRGTVLIECKNGEHHELTGVYLIPRLGTSAASGNSTRMASTSITSTGFCVSAMSAIDSWRECAAPQVVSTPSS